MSKIEWCDKTINPIIGCTKVSPACDNCYAEVMAKRLQSMATDGYSDVIDSKGAWSGQLNFVASALMKPYKWKKPQRIFVGSMTDIFHDDVKAEWIYEILKMVKENPHHTFMFLTKRAHNMQMVMNNYYFHAKCQVIENLWLGVTAENQKEAEVRIPILLKTPTSKRFVSVEPILGEINLEMLIDIKSTDRYRVVYSSLCGNKTLWDNKNLIGEEDINYLDWVIVGGENGHNARPAHYKWIKSLQEQCFEEGIPFFFKQWGEWESGLKAPMDYEKGASSYIKGTYHDFGDEYMALKVGKKNTGKLLNSKLHQEFPRNYKDVL